MKLIDNSCQSE